MGPPRRRRVRVSTVLVAAALVALGALTAAGIVGSGGSTHRGVAATSSLPPRTSSLPPATSPPLSAPCTIAADLAPTCGAWWGEALEATDSSLLSAVTTAQATDGRRLDVVHTYHRWEDVFPTSNEQSLAESGHLLLLNWQPTAPNGSPISWASIASGAQNATIDAEAARLRDFGEPVLLSFSHEPDHDPGLYGTPQQFVAAYRYVHDRVVADGATNVRWVWTVEGIDTASWQARYRQLWPGNSYVDWIAWDPYNFASCMARSWVSFSSLVAPFYRWITAQPFGDKPLMLAEYGTIAAGTGRSETQQAWYAGEASTLAGFPRLKALVYFDYGAPPATSDWRSTSSLAAAEAFGALARSAVFARTAGLVP
jgi:hypothetical protein